MNCRDIESLILAERDGGLPKDQLAALSDHVAACPACHQFRSRLNSALNSLKSEVAAVQLPDVDEAWRDLQTRLNKPARKRPLAPVIWFAIPLAAAAAFAIVFYSNPIPGSKRTAPASEFSAEVARADYVEAGDVNASTMVYVDKESGWLVVWATDGETKTSG